MLTCHQAGWSWLVITTLPCSARLTALETFPAAVRVCLAVEQGTFFQAAIPTRALRHSSPEPHRLLKYHLQSVLFQISKPPSYIH